jgi:hypothetical protein
MPEENDNQTEKIQEASENETPNGSEETPAKFRAGIFSRAAMRSSPLAWREFSLFCSLL